jgi:hypothetical protein
MLFDNTKKHRGSAKDEENNLFLLYHAPLVFVLYQNVIRQREIESIALFTPHRMRQSRVHLRENNLCRCDERNRRRRDLDYFNQASDGMNIRIEKTHAPGVKWSEVSC